MQHRASAIRSRMVGGPRGSPTCTHRRLCIVPNEYPNDPVPKGPDSGPSLLSESGRVEIFSDGVIAIAITLLVLDLKIPVGEPGTVAHRLLEQWPAYLAYLASFITLGVVWV